MKKFTLRMPRSIYRRLLKQVAGGSLNAWIVKRLEAEAARQEDALANETPNLLNREFKDICTHPTYRSDRRCCPHCGKVLNEKIE